MNCVLLAQVQSNRLRVFAFLFLIAAIAGAAETDYAVVAPASMKDDSDWQAVVEGLAKKHNAPVITYDKNVAEAREKLAALAPRYVGFVARPEEAGRQFVIDIHRFLRKLNDDPYTDAIWGIVTGRTAADAMKIVEQTEPLTIHNGAAGTGIPMGVFDEARSYSEGAAGAYQIKTADGKVEQLKGPTDSTKELVDAFNDFKTDLVFHVRTRDRARLADRLFVQEWTVSLQGRRRLRPGFGEEGVQNRFAESKSIHAAGQLFDGAHLGQGLHGAGVHEQRRRAANVRLRRRHVVWIWRLGCAGLFFPAAPGASRLRESVYLNNQALINRLEREYPDKARVDLDVNGMEKERDWFGKTATALGLKEVDEKGKNLIGLLYDRDVVAFYGDPKWEARMGAHDLPWKQTLTESSGVFTFELSAEKTTKAGRPPAAILPRHVGKVEIVEGKELEPVVGANFVMVPKLTEFEAGKTYRVIFKESK